jgi:hypothetical protein
MVIKWDVDLVATFSATVASRGTACWVLRPHYVTRCLKVLMIFAFRLLMRWNIARNHFTAWPLASSSMCTASRVGRVCRCPLLLARRQRLLLLRSNQACNLLLGLLMKLTNLLALLLRFGGQG